MSLLDTLSSEVTQLTDNGERSLSGLIKESDDFLNDLKSLRTTLNIEAQNAEKRSELDLPETTGKSLDVLDKLVSRWYKSSINGLKSYNSSINKFQKNVLNNPAFYINLDDAYTYPLNLDNLPIKTEKKENSDQLSLAKINNRDLLIKSIILHLSKIGQCNIVTDVAKELSAESTIDESLLRKFELLKTIVDDITIKHDLNKALAWFKVKYNQKIVSSPSGNLEAPNHKDIEFKFHMLQFILLFKGLGDDPFSLDNSLSAYLYANDNFTRFFEDYLDDISSLGTLLLCTVNPLESKSPDDSIADFANKVKNDFQLHNSKKNSSESKYVYDLLTNFKTIDSNQVLFVNLANEFISEYCQDLQLSNDSSLFQSLLAGFIYLPNFHKYKTIQNKMQRVSFSEERPVKLTEVLAAPHDFDLPFQLPDSNRFLFNYHSIFICPISKEQLIPISEVEHTYDTNDHKRKKSNESTNNESPLVVLNYCQHVALRESIWQLSNKGLDTFKCHYCYKKHKYAEVSDAYFIDL